MLPEVAHLTIFTVNEREHYRFKVNILLMSTDPLTPFFDQQGFIVLDGALATELERRGADLNDPLWSGRILLQQPELIRQVHLDYFIAGADVAITSTYQVTFPGLRARGLDDAAIRKLLRRGLQLACEARDAFLDRPEAERRIRPLIAASIGPYGAFLADGSEYRGNYGLTDPQLRDFHRPRLEVMAESEADLLALETIPCLQEAEVLIRLLEDYPHCRAWISFCCRDESRNAQGEDFAECIRTVTASPQVIAAGLNCSPPQYALPLLKRARDQTEKPLVVYPNRGEQWDAQKHCWLPHTQGLRLSDQAVAWRRAGAHLIGGCCRTGPADIRELKALLERYMDRSDFS